MAVIIHHTDADGWSGAAVCAKYLSENYDEQVKFVPFSYSDIDEKVFFNREQALQKVLEAEKNKILNEEEE